MALEREADLQRLFMVIWLGGSAATFVFLTFLDGYVYNAWNWLVAIPVNLFLASIWPLYWAVLHWVT